MCDLVSVSINSLLRATGVIIPMRPDSHMKYGDTTRLACLSMILLVSLTVLADASHWSPSTAASTLPITRTVAEDSYIDPWHPSTIWGLSNLLNASSSPSNISTAIFLKFDLLGLPPSSQVNATLSLSLINSSSVIGDKIAAFAESNFAWSENSLTYTNAPRANISSIPYDAKFANPSSTTWNVTGIVQPLIGVKTTVTIVLHHFGPAPASSTLLLFKSKEWGNSQPTLTITYRKNPSSITTLLIPTKTVFGSPVIINSTVRPALETGTVAIQFSLDNLTWSNVDAKPPGANGTVITLWFPPGATTYYIRSTWSGDLLTENATSRIQLLTVTKASTTTSVFLGASGISYGNQTLVIATLRPQLSEGVMRAEYSVDAGGNWAELFSGVPVNGIIFQQFIPSSTGIYLFRAKWLGDANYNASSSLLESLTVAKARTALTLSVSPVIVTVGSSSLVSGFLKIAGGTSISGAKVTLQIRSASISTASVFTNLTTLTTDIDGSFFLPWVPQSNGTYELRVYFSGTNVYQTSSSRIQDVRVELQVFPTTSQIGLISGFIGLIIGLGLSYVVRVRRKVVVKRKQRYGSVKARE